jgi:hypothetical protein
VKKAIISFVTSVAMVLAPVSVMAAGSAPSKTPSAPTHLASAGPLAPGGAAGVKQAQGFEDIPLLWIVAGVVVAGVAIWAISDNSDNNNSTSTTGT